MDELQRYLKPRGRTTDLARDLGVSPAYLYQMATGRRPFQLTLVARAAEITGLAKWCFRPDDWWEIWPELLKVKGAPRVVAKAA